MSTANIDGKQPNRINAFDVLRGITVISMVLFHASYDLVYIYGVDLAWFINPIIQDIWRCSISWTFLFLAGWMCGFSRSNFRRGMKYALVALIVFIATSIARVDIPINYGIIYCMAASTLVLHLLCQTKIRIDPAFGLMLCLLAFAATYSIPKCTYPIEHLAWLGFPSDTFASGDYYPLIPFAFMYAAGFFAMKLLEQKGISYERTPFTLACKPIEFLGQHSLEIYVAHQPLIILLFSFMLGAT